MVFNQESIEYQYVAKWFTNISIKVRLIYMSLAITKTEQKNIIKFKVNSI